MTCATGSMGIRVVGRFIEVGIDVDRGRTLVKVEDEAVNSFAELEWKGR